MWKGFPALWLRDQLMLPWVLVFPRWELIHLENLGSILL